MSTITIELDPITRARLDAIVSHHRITPEEYVRLMMTVIIKRVELSTTVDPKAAAEDAELEPLIKEAIQATRADRRRSTAAVIPPARPEIGVP